MNIMKEVSRVLIFAMCVAFPMILAREFDNQKYLWFYALSSVFIFTLFDDYDKEDKNNNQKFG